MNHCIIKYSHLTLHGKEHESEKERSEVFENL